MKDKRYKLSDENAEKLNEDLFYGKDKIYLKNEEPKAECDELLKKYMKKIHQKFCLDNIVKIVDLNEIIEEFKKELDKLMEKYYVDTY